MTDFITLKFPGKKVVALFAGLHISKLKDEDLEKTINYFARCDLYKKIYTLHCTGEKAGKMIEQRLGGKLVSVGDVFEL